jgi:hypothetical protein
VAGDVATTTIEISQESYLSYPIAPADLRRPDTHESLWHLHQLIAREGPHLVFESYQQTFTPLQLGGPYEFCSWWLPEALDAVRDLSATWERLPYLNRDYCERCLLTYETMDEQGEGYRSSYGWITVAAYHEFIEEDRLRVRTRWRSIELSRRSART